MKNMKPSFKIILAPIYSNPYVQICLKEVSSQHIKTTKMPLTSESSCVKLLSAF